MVPRSEVASVPVHGLFVQRGSPLHSCAVFKVRCAVFKVRGRAEARRVKIVVLVKHVPCAVSGLSVVPAMVAERLGVPALCFADTLKVKEKSVEVCRDDGIGPEVFAADLPAVVSVTKRCGEPRYPRFVATLAARHKLVRTWSLAALDIDEAEVGRRAAAAVVRSATPQTREAARIIVDGDATSTAIRLADFLSERQFL